MTGTAIPQVRRHADSHAVCHAAAETFCAAFEEREAAGRQRFRVALSGGSTPRRFHALLAAPPYRDRVDWREVDFFWGDERALPPEHPDSNFRMARESLLDPLAIDPGQVHRMPADAADLDAAAHAYQLEIAETFGADPAGPPPRFDLLLQGMGSDGHTASLFPGSAALSERRRWVVGNVVGSVMANVMANVVANVVAKEVSSQDAVGTARRMTFTYPLINAAARVVFLVSGAGKARALAGVLEGPRDPERLPAQAVAPTKGVLLWLVDEAAAGELRDA
jgi:6-phosphogluconolactonase